MILDKSHPYWHVRSVIESQPNAESLTLSYYVYRPQSLIDEREVISINRSDFLVADCIVDLIKQCPPDHDLALHSLVDFSECSAKHLPMVDMSTNARAHLSKLKSYLDEETYYGFSWFDSGRSFHGYGSRFIEHAEWVRYMGQLLLSNQKDLKPTVDPRWIGHRLIAGYSALRWTRNTEHYLRMPQKVLF